jgi:hypothetical protein
MSKSAVLPAVIPVLLAVLTAGSATGVQAAAGPTPVPGFKSPEPGEHPRLFFRKSEIPELRKRAETPEGRAIVERLKFLLGSTDACPRKKIDAHHHRKAFDSWTLGHAMGYGLLYHLTGEKKYIAMSKEAMEIAYSGECDESFGGKPTYSWKAVVRRDQPTASGGAVAHQLADRD